MSPASVSSGSPSAEGSRDDPFDSESEGEAGEGDSRAAERAPLRRGGKYAPRPVAVLLEDMNIPAVRDASKATGTLKQYAAEVERFEMFVQYACARNLRRMVGEAAAANYITQYGDACPPNGMEIGPAVVDFPRLYSSPPRRCDGLVHAFMADRSDGWTRSESKMKKIVASLSRKFHDAGSKGPLNGVMGNPVESPEVKEVRSNHVERRRRAATAVKGVDPVRYKDVDRYYETNFAGKPLQQWNPERVMLYSSVLVGMNLCVRFNELGRLRYVRTPPSLLLLTHHFTSYRW